MLHGKTVLPALATAMATTMTITTTETTKTPAIRTMTITTAMVVAIATAITRGSPILVRRPQLPKLRSLCTRLYHPELIYVLYLPPTNDY